jgi:hypothetical protein
MGRYAIAQDWTARDLTTQDNKTYQFFLTAPDLIPPALTAWDVTLCYITGLDRTRLNLIGQHKPPSD